MPVTPAASSKPVLPGHIGFAARTDNWENLEPGTSIRIGYDIDTSAKVRGTRPSASYAEAYKGEKLLGPVERHTIPVSKDERAALEPVRQAVMASGLLTAPATPVPSGVQPLNTARFIYSTPEGDRMVAIPEEGPLALGAEQVNEAMNAYWDQVGPVDQG